MLPPQVIPLLEATVQSPGVGRSTPIEFWRSENHRIWVAAFSELGSLLHDSGFASDSALPRGYSLVGTLFDWEQQCQFSGWGAFDNRAATFEQVLAAFEEVGVKSEATALRAAHRAWLGSGGEHDAASSAYDLERHELSIDLDRMEHLACYFVDNAERLFYSEERA